jgi:peroxiredoxin Q/BCP
MYLLIGSVALLLAAFYLMSRTGGAGQTALKTEDPMHASSGSNEPQLPIVGKSITEFSLKDRNGIPYTAENFKGKTTVLFFNEGLMCYPSCWNQMVSLANDSRFQGPDIQVFAIVVDDPNEWDQAIKKMPELGKATVLFDTDRKVSKSLDMLTAGSSMHSGSYPGHSYVIVDALGTVRFAFDDPRMAINNDLLASKLSELK